MIAVPEWLAQALVCPVCRGAIAPSDAALDCAGCGRRFLQTDPEGVALLAPPPESAQWERRQRWMAREYDALLDDGDHPARAFENDYRGLGPHLGRCRGRIADIGGGIGVSRHWLPSEAEYVLVEPSTMWRDTRWRAHASRFPCLATPPLHVLAYAEALPFASSLFDVVLCLWSLNHVRDVSRSVDEAVRVLKPGGCLLVVLEDMPPTWRDLWTGSHPEAATGRRLSLALAKLRSLVAGPLLQPDHLAVRERELTARSSLRVVERWWMGSYLAMVCEALGARSRGAGAP